MSLNLKVLQTDSPDLLRELFNEYGLFKERKQLVHR